MRKIQKERDANHVGARPGRFFFDKCISIMHPTGECKFFRMIDGLAHAVSDDKGSRATDATLTMDERLELVLAGPVDEGKDFGGAEYLRQPVLIVGPWKLDVVQGRPRGVAVCI